MGKSAAAWLAATAAVAAAHPHSGSSLAAGVLLRSATTQSAASAVEHPHNILPWGGAWRNLPRGGGDGKEDSSSPLSQKKEASSSSAKKKKRRRKKSETTATKGGESASSFPPGSAPVPQEKATSPPQDKKAEESQQSPPPPPPPQQSPPPQTFPIVEEIMVEEDYYRILGTTKEANSVIIKKSYRRRALQTHPDKTGGDRRAFDKVAEAYGVLSDDTKRPLYDRYGKRGVEQANGSGAGPGSFQAEDLFRSFFSGGRGGHPFFSQQQQQRQQQQSRNRTVRYQLEVTLEDLYQGLARKVAIAAPDRQTAAAKEVQVNIPRGALSGQSIRLAGAMDFDHNDTPGDLIFALHQRPHRCFTRKGHDLAMSMTISLDEAINGVTLTVTHLDGRALVIGSARHGKGGHVAAMIQTGDVHVLKGKGMPKNAQATDYGDLYVQYEVELPKKPSDRLTVEERTELGRLLRKLEGRREVKLPSSSDIHYLHPARVSDFGRASGRPEIPREEEDHNHPGEDPFGGGSRSSYYWSSPPGAGASPFFGMNPEDMFRGPPTSGSGDDENAQCRQM
jgi:DnaJ-class molecular chaperone